MEDQMFDDDDDLDDEAETRERYPFLFDDDDSEGSADGPSASNADSIDNDRPNYYYLQSLSEEHLPRLDFSRVDNYFGGKPAYAYYKRGSTADKRISPRQLFGEYWLEGELAILFADAGAGKSVLATQIAQSIASGRAIEPFGSDTPPRRVVFFDLELSDDQFDNRYSHIDTAHPAKFPFHKNFIRSTPNRDADMPEWAASESHFILGSIVRFLEFSKADVAIIDNISWLNKGASEQRFLRALARIRRELKLSILVLAHTPKSRFRMPLSVSDLRGSKMIASFADSIFALGSSRLGADVRYLKTIKKRNIQAEDSNRVETFRIRKDVCFLSMKHEGISDERDHIGWMSSSYEPEKIAIIEKIGDLSREKLTQREIGERLGVSAATVNRLMKEAAAFS